MPEVLLALALIICVVLAALCYWGILSLRNHERPPMMGLIIEDDTQHPVALVATLFAIVPICIYLMVKLNRFHNKEPKAADESAPDPRRSVQTVKEGARARNETEAEPTSSGHTR